MEQKDVALTYETLFEFLRLEKGREDIQKLQSTFFEDVVDYLEEKQKILETSSNKLDLFSSTEKDKIKHQIDNTKRILKELYERRERKIINLSLVKSKTGTTAIDTSAMLPQEKQMFDELSNNLDRYRKGILMNLFNNALPSIEQFKQETKDQEEETKEEHKDFLMIRFKKPVPQFVGKELESYGPFEEDDVAGIPVDIARLLIEKNRAELME